VRKDSLLRTRTKIFNTEYNSLSIHFCRARAARQTIRAESRTAAKTAAFESYHRR
jgi:hypothetical protein